MNYENDAIGQMDPSLGSLDELWSSMTRSTAQLQKTYQQYLSEVYLQENKAALDRVLDNPQLNRALMLSTEGFKTGIETLVNKIIDLVLRIFGYLKAALGIYAWRGREIRNSGRKLLESIAGIKDNSAAEKIYDEVAFQNLHINGRFPNNLAREFEAVMEKWEQVLGGLDSAKFVGLIDALSKNKDTVTAVSDVRIEINTLFGSITPIADTDPSHIGLSTALKGQDFRVSRVMPGQRFIYAYLAETPELVGKFKAGVQKDNHHTVSNQPQPPLTIRQVEALANALVELGGELSRVSEGVSEVERLERYVKRLNASSQTKPQELSSVVAYPQAFQALYSGLGAAVVSISKAVILVCKLSVNAHTKKPS